jgi:hypothetical protein
MRSSRRALFWIAILGLAITLVAFLQRRDGEPAAAEAAGNTPQQIEATRTVQRADPADVSAASTADSRDEADLKCAQTLNDAADFVLRENNLPDPLQDRESDADNDRLPGELNEAQRILAGSPDPEHFLAALLLEPPENRISNDASAQAKRLELGERAARSGLKVLAWHALNACAAAKQSCPIAHLEQRLLEADKQNAEAWALVATLRYKRGDVAGALAAVQGAASAPTSTWYWSETIDLIERSLAAQTKMRYVDRMGAAVAAGVPTPFDLGAFRDMCKVESASTRSWSKACLDYVTLRGKRNETMAARLTAHSMREQILTALGEREGAAEAAAQTVTERAQMSAELNAVQEPGRSMWRLRWALTASDPALLHAYLGALQQSGEIEGHRMFLRQEVPSVLERTGLLQRNGVRECAAQFFVGTRPASAGQRVQVADDLLVATVGPNRLGQKTLRIPPDGRITVPFIPGTRTVDGKSMPSEREIVAAGKTTEQLRREIEMILSAYHRSPQVILTLFPRGLPEDLHLEFDNARKEAAQRRSTPR